MWYYTVGVKLFFEFILEEFTLDRKNLCGHRPWKISGMSEKFLDTLESFWAAWKVYGQSGKFLDSLESFWTVCKVFEWSWKFPNSVESLQTVWKKKFSVCAAVKHINWHLWECSSNCIRLKVTAEVNKKITNFLDVTLNLNTRTNRPYRKLHKPPLHKHRADGPVTIVIWDLKDPDILSILCSSVEKLFPGLKTKKSVLSRTGVLNQWRW